jgi:folate-binding protein YgfZ
MPEVVEAAIKISPLHQTHAHLGAVMTERDGWSVPASYGDELFEYAAIREGGAGLIDLSARGRLLVSGSEAVQFLNGLITNDVKTLEQQRWMPAAFPNVQGRLLASVRVIRRDDGFLIDTESPTHEVVMKTLSRFTFAGDFRVTDVSEQLAHLSVQGARAPALLLLVFGEAGASIANNERHAVRTTKWQADEVTIIRSTHTGEDGFDLFVSANKAPALWASLQAAGARPCGFEALEILRIEAGQARYGIDMDDANVVSETNLDDAISFTKGCYIGQEIIARIKYRGHVAKKLTGLVFEQPLNIETGAQIHSVDDKDVGRITSRTLSPHLGTTIALGYVKFDYLAPGTSVRVVSGDLVHTAHVVALPIVRGSWQELPAEEPQN